MTIENKRNISEETEMNAVILEPLGIPEERLAELRKPLEEKGVVFTSYARTGDTEELKKEVADADILIIANMPLPGEVIAAAEKQNFWILLSLVWTMLTSRPAEKTVLR